MGSNHTLEQWGTAINASLVPHRIILLDGADCPDAHLAADSLIAAIVDHHQVDFGCSNVLILKVAKLVLKIKDPP